MNTTAQRGTPKTLNEAIVNGTDDALLHGFTPGSADFAERIEIHVRDFLAQRYTVIIGEACKESESAAEKMKAIYQSLVKKPS